MEIFREQRAEKFHHNTRQVGEHDDRGRNQPHPTRRTAGMWLPTTAAVGPIVAVSA